jgi:hypothetical protein
VETRHKKMMKEEELAARVVAWLSNQRWEVYQEVQVESYGRRADIVAVQGPVSWVIETKMSFGIGVLDQALYWVGMANYVSVATPYGRGIRSTVLKRSMESIGLGSLLVRDWGIEERIHPRLQRRLRRDIRKYLNEPQKTFAPAGNAHGARYTPFQETCRKIVDRVKIQPGIGIKELIDNIETHYLSSKTARSVLAKWIQQGVVKGVRAEYEGRALRLYPE